MKISFPDCVLISDTKLDPSVFLRQESFLIGCWKDDFTVNRDAVSLISDHAGCYVKVINKRFRNTEALKACLDPVPL